jgi:seryl-tRNA synthetase
MPQIRDLREKKNDYLKCLASRGVPNSGFLKGLEKYEDFRKLKKEADDLRAERNRKSVEFAKTHDKKIIESMKKLKEELSRKDEASEGVEAELREIELTLPNWFDTSVPIGESDVQNVTVKTVGTPRVIKGNEKEFKKNFGKEFTATEKIPHHSEIVEMLDLVDMDAAGKLAGSRFYFEKNSLSILDLSLSLLAMKEFAKKGFTPIIPPYMMKRATEEKITYFTAFEDSIYSLKDDDLILITTSEHPLAAMLEGKIFEEKELPLRMVAFSPAFRREAGSHGKDTKGIFRTHHFNKVELHSVAAPGRGRAELKFAMDAVESLMKKFEVPYRVVQNSSGDMDKRAFLQYDLEGWFPAQNNYRELHSFATVGTWISEKIGTKVRINNESQFVENVYATGIAVQRTLLAILVNGFDPKTGTVAIPKLLAEISGVDEIAMQKK